MGCKKVVLNGLKSFPKKFTYSSSSVGTKSFIVEKYQKKIQNTYKSCLPSYIEEKDTNATYSNLAWTVR